MTGPQIGSLDCGESGIRERGVFILASLEQEIQQPRRLGIAQRMWLGTELF
jgi:hypothetical protein